MEWFVVRAPLTGYRKPVNLSAMKATIDIPDELYRRVKARTAVEGRRIREVAVELFRQWLDDGPLAPAASGIPLVTEAGLRRQP